MNRFFGVPALVFHSIACCVAFRSSAVQMASAKIPAPFFSFRYSTSKRLAGFLSFLVLCSFQPVEKPRQTNIYHTTAGKIDFRSEAPLELIRASSNQLIGLLDIQKKNFSFKINIRTFQGFNSPLQREHFNENYMESNKYPEASFSGKIIEDVDLSQSGTYSVRAKGILTIHGVQQERIIKSDVVVNGSKINITSNFTVLLSDHNIPIPKVVYQKLANEIKVEISTTLEPR